MTAREAFVMKWGSTARELTAGTGIFPEIMLSQAIVESSGFNGREWVPGLSQLAQSANNYFGIKADPSWKGQSVEFKTGEYFNGKPTKVIGKFRKYSSPVESFKDYIRFLQTNPRYKAAGVFSAATAEDQAKALKAAGYATDPNYVTLISSVASQVSGYLKRIPMIGKGLILAAVFFLIYQISKR